MLRASDIAAFWNNRMCHSGVMEVGSVIFATGEVADCGQIPVASRAAVEVVSKLRTLRWGVGVLASDSFEVWLGVVGPHT